VAAGLDNAGQFITLKAVPRPREELARHGVDPCGPVAGVQVCLATPITSDDYVAGQRWRDATVRGCPWHRQGGCGFSRHGTYPRVRPPGALIACWYCPLERRTVSALPDCLASHYSGTLVDLEAMVLAVERARSLPAAVDALRTDIELPGALRYLRRLCQAVHDALGIVRGLQPARFAGVPLTLQGFAAALPGCLSGLVALRALASQYLSLLPTPLGFDPARQNAAGLSPAFQHRMGPDPPLAILDAPA